MENLYFTVMIVVCCLCFMLILNCRNQVADRLTLLRLFLLIFHEAFHKLACVCMALCMYVCVYIRNSMYTHLSYFSEMSCLWKSAWHVT